MHYSVNPYAEPKGTAGVYFSPIGVAGVILQDKNWTIEHKLDGAPSFTKVSWETPLSDWEVFWKEWQQYMCFVPSYYEGCTIE